MKHYLISFESTHSAIRTEKLLKPHGKVTMIPVPRDLTASCGLALQFEEESLAVMAGVLKEHWETGMRLFLVTRSGEGPREYTEMDWGNLHADGHTAGGYC